MSTITFATFDFTAESAYGDEQGAGNFEFLGLRPTIRFDGELLWQGEIYDPAAREGLIIEDAQAHFVTVMTQLLNQ